MFLIFPLTSEYFEKSNKEAINRLISIFYNYFSILILSLSAIFIALGPEIATGLF
jgi:O-antigen/teichoic acid export membrane protein